jgi:hypothetical protein
VRRPAVTPQLNSRLIRLASYIASATAEPAGDATLVIRDQRYPNGTSYSGADLYVDNGTYYFATNEDGLAAAIADSDTQVGGWFLREIDAAKFAVNGNLSTALTMMEDAALGHSPSSAPKVYASAAAQRALEAVRGQSVLGDPDDVDADNLIWENSIDALVAGAGDPQVRAGVLRLIAALPSVSVVDTDANGQPAPTLTAGSAELLPNYTEALTINADTGVPVGFVGGTPGKTSGVTITYQVSRVSVSNIAAGRF